MLVSTHTKWVLEAPTTLSCLMCISLCDDHHHPWEDWHVVYIDLSSRAKRCGLAALDFRLSSYSDSLKASLCVCVKAAVLASVGFKLAVRGDSGADGLEAPLPCTAYFGMLAKLFGCSLP